MTRIGRMLWTRFSNIWYIAKTFIYNMFLFILVGALNTILLCAITGEEWDNLLLVLCINIFVMTTYTGWINGMFILLLYLTNISKGVYENKYLVCVESLMCFIVNIVLNELFELIPYQIRYGYFDNDGITGYGQRIWATSDAILLYTFIVLFLIVFAIKVLSVGNRNVINLINGKGKIKR